MIKYIFEHRIWIEEVHTQTHAQITEIFHSFWYFRVYMYYLQIGTIRRRVSSLFSEWYTCHSSLLWARRLFWSIRSTNSEQYCGIVRCCCHTISTAWSYNEQNSVSPRGGAGSEQRQSHWRWINTKLYIYFPNFLGMKMARQKKLPCWTFKEAK